MRPQHDERLDREKIRAWVHRYLGGLEVRILLDRAIGLVSAEDFPELMADYADLKSLVVDENTDYDFLASIGAFYDESLAGRYYEEFDVNSRNCTTFSRGTEVFIAIHTRFVEECLNRAEDGDIEIATEGLTMLIELMREIDRWQRDIVFFADEAGSWQVGVLWERVLPVWFQGISKKMVAGTWAETVVNAIQEFADYRKDILLQQAKEVGTKEQVDALAILAQNFPTWR